MMAITVLMSGKYSILLFWCIRYGALILLSGSGNVEMLMKAVFMV